MILPLKYVPSAHAAEQEPHEVYWKHKSWEDPIWIKKITSNGASVKEGEDKKINIFFQTRIMT